MKHRTLVADDEESARSGLASLLSTWGHDVELAADGKDALGRAAELEPSVVIEDARRRDPRHDPPDPSQQSPALAVRGG